MLLKRLQPASEILLLFPVFEKPDTFRDFPDGYDTEKKTLGIEQVNGAAYARIALGWRNSESTEVSSRTLNI